VPRGEDLHTQDNDQADKKQMGLINQ